MEQGGRHGARVVSPWRIPWTPPWNFPNIPMNLDAL